MFLISTDWISSLGQHLLQTFSFKKLVRAFPEPKWARFACFSERMWLCFFPFGSRVCWFLLWCCTNSAEKKCLEACSFQSTHLNPSTKENETVQCLLVPCSLQRTQPVWHSWLFWGCFFPSFSGLGFLPLFPKSRLLSLALCTAYFCWPGLLHFPHSYSIKMGNPSLLTGLWGCEFTSATWS